MSGPNQTQTPPKRADPIAAVLEALEETLAMAEHSQRSVSADCNCEVCIRERGVIKRGRAALAAYAAAGQTGYDLIDAVGLLFLDAMSVKAEPKSYATRCIALVRQHDAAAGRTVEFEDEKGGGANDDRGHSSKSSTRDSEEVQKGPDDTSPAVKGGARLKFIEHIVQLVKDGYEAEAKSLLDYELPLIRPPRQSEDVESMARELVERIKFGLGTLNHKTELVLAFAARVAADQRERDAKIAEAEELPDERLVWITRYDDDLAQAAIRATGKAKAAAIRAQGGNR